MDSEAHSASAALALAERLLQHAEDQYEKGWMSQIEDGEDPAYVRQEGRRTFRRIASGKRG